MFNVALYALMSLSFLSGQSLKFDHKIELKPKNVELANKILSKNSYSNDSLITKIEDIYDINGRDSYVFFQSAEGNYVLIDKLMNQEIETGYVDNSPYRHVSDSFIIRTDSEHFYYDYITNKFISYENNDYLKETDLRSPSWDEYFEACVSSEHVEATFINNAKYFDNLNSKFGNNNSNICGIIASEILLGYFDTFSNDNIVDEIYDISGDFCSLYTDQGNSPGTDLSCEQFNNEFRDLLVSKATIWNDQNPVYNGMTNGEVYNLIEEYLDFRGINGSVTSYPLSYLYTSVVESFIDNNKPFLASLSDHFVVVYGYDDDYYYLSNGWADLNGNDTGRLPKQFFTNFSSPYALTLIINDHVHSNNYYKNTDFGLYCGCGYHHSNRLIMNPSDWNFEEQYFFYQKNSVHLKDNLNFVSRRYRTGYIQSSVINLSPRRENAGSAWFEIIFSNQIYQFDLQIAWWSQQEHQNDGFAYLKHHEINDSSTTWHAYLASFTELTISQYYGLLTQLRFILPNNCDGLKFELGNLAVGNRNLGRLSLGQMVFDYYV